MRRSEGARTLIASAPSLSPGIRREGSASTIVGKAAGSTVVRVGSSCGHSMCGWMVASSTPSGSIVFETVGVRDTMPFESV